MSVTMATVIAMYLSYSGIFPRFCFLMSSGFLVGLRLRCCLSDSITLIPFGRKLDIYQYRIALRSNVLQLSGVKRDNVISLLISHLSQFFRCI